MPCLKNGAKSHRSLLVSVLLVMAEIGQSGILEHSPMNDWRYAWKITQKILRLTDLHESRKLEQNIVWAWSRLALLESFHSSQWSKTTNLVASYTGYSLWYIMSCIEFDMATRRLKPSGAITVHRDWACRASWHWNDERHEPSTFM